MLSCRHPDAHGQVPVPLCSPHPQGHGIGGTQECADTHELSGTAHKAQGKSRALTGLCAASLPSCQVTHP